MSALRGPAEKMHMAVLLRQDLVKKQFGYQLNRIPSNNGVSSSGRPGSLSCSSLMLLLPAILFLDYASVSGSAM